MIPEFDSNGNLPVGIHWTTWQEFANRFGKTVHRQRLLKGLRMAVDVLAIAGCRTFYVDGSFVTSKQIPGDFDACWDASGVDIDLLNMIEPLLLPRTIGGKWSLKGKYSGDIYPNIVELNSGKTFLAFFQIDKETGNQKGIIALDLRRL